VGALGDTLARLGPIIAIAGHPIAIVFIALLALAAWGAVTFVAVRAAIRSAARAGARP
jgi:hypothetical protein